MDKAFPTLNTCFFVSNILKLDLEHNYVEIMEPWTGKEVCPQTWPDSPLQGALGWRLPGRPATAHCALNGLDLDMAVKSIYYFKSLIGPLGWVPIQSSAYGVVSTAEKGGQAFGANLRMIWVFTVQCIVFQLRTLDTPTLPPGWRSLACPRRTLVHCTQAPSLQLQDARETTKVFRACNICFTKAILHWKSVHQVTM